MVARSDKDEVRAAVLRARSALDPLVRAAGDAARTSALLGALGETRGGQLPRCVTCYVSVGTEPNTSDLLAALATAGVEVLLPRLRADGSMEFVRDDRGPRAAGVRGIPAPVGPARSTDRVEVWMVPALAVDRGGGRLGRGGGSYDRVLPAGVPAVALLHAGELLRRVPVRSHDRPVTHAALPDGVVQLVPAVGP